MKVELTNPMTGNTHVETVIFTTSHSASHDGQAVMWNVRYGVLDHQTWLSHSGKVVEDTPAEREQFGRWLASGGAAGVDIFSMMLDTLAPAASELAARSLFETAHSPPPPADERLKYIPRPGSVSDATLEAVDQWLEKHRDDTVMNIGPKR